MRRVPLVTASVAARLLVEIEPGCYIGGVIPALGMVWLAFVLGQDPASRTLAVGREEVVVVTAARGSQAIEKTASLVTAIAHDRLARVPALVLDDRLRRVPGFSLFRRSSSLVAHPTTQGVSLRGIGPSGAGRTLVLFDGVPLNDPFGGWVYWSRLPDAAVEVIEIVRGAGSALYGSSALGGVIQLLPRAPGADIVEVGARAGTRETYAASLHAADVSGPWAYALAGQAFDTEGFFVVDEAERGKVDERARSGFRGLIASGSRGPLRVGWSLYDEDRANGTPLQRNDSRLSMLHAQWQGTRWTGSGYWQSGRFRSAFSRILPDRSAEFLTAEDDIRATGRGGALTWRPRGHLLLGADLRRVAWDGRSQDLAGLFVQELRPLGARAELLAGVRFDVWDNRKTQATLNPRLGLAVRASEALAIRASAYRGFRAPTLNELYRPFRVGNVLTEANADLVEESLVGAEAGFDWRPARALAMRANAYWNSLRDPVGNVTVDSSAALVLRQRRNIGRATVRGLEAEADVRGGSAWRLRTAYLHSDTRVQETGLRLAQVPRHQAALSLDYDGPIQATADARWVAAQFEDDRNTLRLGAFWLLGFSLRRVVSPRLTLFASVENLLDREYVVGRTPVATLGTPRMAHAGLELSLGKSRAR